MENVVNNILLRVFLNNSHSSYVDVPVTCDTVCSDVIAYCKPAGEQHYHLAELWRGCERPVGVDEKVYDLLEQWGPHRHQVSFYLRRGVIMPVPQSDQGRRNTKGRNGTREDEQDNVVGGGVDLTLTELQDMASRQQRQIDDQQQMLVAKEQRLKFLKQQEVRHQQIASENERLRKLREKVEAQELKLKKLRAMRGQVSDQKHSNSSLSSELETIKSLFNEKEKELSMAVNKVEELTRQLEEVRRGRMDVSVSSGGSSGDNAPFLELQKLRKEVVIRNKLNEQQHSKLTAHQDILNQRHNEMTTMDKRIAELQQRLRTKKQLQQQANRNHSNNVLSNQGNKPDWSGNNVAAVEPFRVGSEDSGQGTLSKQDPKYQSLPFNVKFPDQNKENRSLGNRGQISTGMPVNKALQKVAGTSSHVQQQHAGGGTTGASSVQNSPSILYAAGESPGSPLTSTPVTTSHPPVQSSTKSASSSTLHPSTPVTTKQSSIGVSNREIFIVGAPAASSLPQHVRTGSNESPVSRISPFQHERSGSGDSSSQLHHSRTGSNDRTSPFQHEGSGSHSRTGSNESRSSLPSNQPALAHHQKQASDEHKRNQNEVGRSESTSALPHVNPSHQQPITRQINSDSNIHTVPQSAGKPGVVRYASRDVIANTYTNKLNSEAMDQYRKNMNQLYLKSGASSSETGDKSKGMSTSPKPVTSPQGVSTSPKGAVVSDKAAKKTAEVGSPTATVKPFQQQQKPAPISPVAVDSSLANRTTSPTVGKAESPNSTGKPDQSTTAKYGGVHNIDPDRSRYGKQGQVHAPRPLRRRHSSGGDSSPEGQRPKNKYHAPTNLVQDQSLSPVTGQAPQNSSVHTPPPVDQHPTAISPPDIVHVDLTLNEDDDEDEKTPAATIPVITVASTEDIPFADEESPAPRQSLPVALRRRKGNLKSKDYVRSSRRVSFDPLALLLDAALEGELDLVVKSAHEVNDPSCPNDEGITALHNAICAGHYDIVKFLVEYGCDVNSPDSDGWTPLHCAASCNNLGMVRILVEHGACIFAETISDQETAAEKCEEDEEGFHGCSEYLYSIQEKLGIANKGEVFSVFDYEATGPDELTFSNGHSLFVIRKGDEQEKEWWWAKVGAGKHKQKQGYIPRNLLGMFARIKPKWLKD